MEHKKGTRRKKLKRIISSLLHSNYVRFGIILPLFYLFVVYTTYYYEQDRSISSVGDSYWYYLFAFITGVFKFDAKTVPGRAITLTTSIVRICLYGTILAKISSFLISSQNQKDKGLLKLKNLSKHFLLCGWKADMEKIIEAVLNANTDLTPDQIVLINEAPPEQIAQIRSQPAYKELNYVSGDFSNEEVLKKALVKTAERVLVISDTTKGHTQLEIDSRTVLAVLAIKNLNPSVYVAAELYDEKFENHLNLAHCDEIILTTEYEHSLLATASSGKGFSNVIRCMLGADTHAGVYIENIPYKFHGKTYGEYAEAQNGDGGKKALLIGLLLNTGNFQRRRRDAIREAHKNPNVEKVIDDLMKIKTLKSNDPILLPDDDLVLRTGMKAIFIRVKEVKHEDSDSKGTI